MSNKLRGKIVTQTAVIGLYRKGDIDANEAALASWSIWGDELSYIAIGTVARQPATLPILAAYVASELFEDPEPLVEFLDEYYYPVTTQIGGDIRSELPSSPIQVGAALVTEYKKGTHKPVITLIKHRLGLPF